MKKIFIAGTDTEIGKTYVSKQLLLAYNQQGYSTIGLKPVASGCKRINNQLYNEDTLALQEAASIKLSHDEITPFAFEPAIAPHIAAQEAGNQLSVNNITNALSQTINKTNADICIIEGCGGWYTPLNSKESMADVVTALDLPVILVVGIRLGCINHALLTEQAILKDGANLMGWIANPIDPHMLVAEENIVFFRKKLEINGLKNDLITYQFDL